MIIVHVSAECYPMAKTGGLADVVGALPKYQNELGQDAKVIMPMHRTKFLYDNEWEVAHKGGFEFGNHYLDFTIIKLTSKNLGFELYCVDINGLLDREKIYGYDDDPDRFIAFQIAVLDWINSWEYLPDILHVHDHHTALIPFMLKYCYVYERLKSISTVLTIHNAQYQGWMGWNNAALLPAWDTWRWGLLDWDNTVNSLACGIKCCEYLTTVSPGYLEELKKNANGLESLIFSESAKSMGILNGIDFETWDPNTDTLILDNYSVKDVESGKMLNKKMLAKDFGLDEQLPLFVFIGRLVPEKAADIIPESLVEIDKTNANQLSFLILGSGNPDLEKQFSSLQKNYVGYYNTRFEYNEKLAHQMYAGADFLIMPSRIEPCGLNQMYALRYGTMPMVRRTGGLKDSVVDIGEENGFGICFDNASVEDLVHSIKRALALYQEKEKFAQYRLNMMSIDNSWEHSAKKYISIYENIK